MPSGTAGQTPALKLYYEGGDANGPLGFGWSLPNASIQRRSDQGVPLYEGEAPPTVGDDWSPRYNHFINDMREELVPTDDGYYFCKNEGAFIRYQRTNDYWLATLPDGTRMEFGVTQEGRVQDTNANPARVFSWLLQRETDTHGNAIVYSYTSFPEPQNSNQVYLSEIRYGPGAPAQSLSNGAPWQNFHFVRFHYQVRPDWFEDCRSGFAVRTGRRLARIDIGTQGPTLANHQQGDFNGDSLTDNLVRRYELGYLNYAGPATHWSLLAAVTPVGADGVSTLPPSSFGYTVCNSPETLSAAGHIVLSFNEPSRLMNNTNVELIDLNGDALPDVLDTFPGGGIQRAFINLGEVELEGANVLRWTNSITVAGDARAASYPLSLSSVHLADLDGDGLADLISQPSASTMYFFRNEGNVSWGNRRTFLYEDFAPPSPYGNTDVRTADLDFDKQIDLIQSVDASRYFVWLRLGPDRYSGRMSRTNVLGALFSQTGVHVTEFNGDRVPDIARVRQDSVVVTAGLGYGRFASPQVVVLDELLTSSQAQNAQLQDITGDGLADLVIERAVGNELWYWVNLGNYHFGPRKRITGLPAPASGSVVRWADLNGNGSTDLIYAGGGSENRLKMVELGLLLNCAPTPNALTAISNGIGRVTLIGYAPSTKFAQEDAASGRPWTNAMPFPVLVVASVTNLDSLGHEYRTEFRYHDGYYDPVEKQFRGFGRVEVVELGDPTAPTLVTRSHFDTGRDYEAMKGRLLRLTTETEDGRVFNDDVTTWTLPPRVLMTGTNGTNISYAHPIGHQKRIIELGQSPERLLETVMAYDQFGNQTTNIDYGIVENGDRSAFDDERVTVTDYAINTDLWLIRNPMRMEVRDENGAVASRSDSFYDDETFSGNNAGLVTIGNLTLRRDWISPSNFTEVIKAARTKYDSYGNPIALLDPLAAAEGGSIDASQGHHRELAYDARFHTYPIRETIHLGSGKEPLVFQADYDEGFGTASATIDFNNHRTTYGYDVFARLVNVVKPYDTPAYPTAEYHYALAVPAADGGVVNFIETRQLDKQPGSAASKRDHYLLSRQFVDGLGRKLMTKQEAEPAPESSVPRAVVSEAILFNARKSPARVINPFFSLQSGAGLDEMFAFENIEAPNWQGSFELQGELVSLSLAVAHQSATHYDAALRETIHVNPDGSQRANRYEPLVQFSYDENDSDPASAYADTPLVHYTDGLGRLVRVDEITRLNNDGTQGGSSNVWTTRYVYDLNDQLTRVIDSQNNEKTMTLDGLKRMTLMDDPDRGRMTYVYDEASNLRETLDAKGQRITFTYDGANRILTEDYHDEGLPFSANHAYTAGQSVTANNRPDVAYYYDVPFPGLDQGDTTTATARNCRGLLAYVWDLTGEEHTSYDNRGRIENTVKRIPDPVLQGSNAPATPRLVSYKISFGYDSLDRVTRVVYPDNDEVSYEYNERNLLRRIPGGPTGSVISNIVYYPSSQQARTDYGNGVRTSYSHDSRLRLTTLATVSESASVNLPLIDFGYQYDGASNIRAIHDNRPGTAVVENDPRRNTQLFEYDDLYRLTRVQYSGNLPGQAVRDNGAIHYRYDQIGNLLAQTSDIQHFDEQSISLTQLGNISYGGALGRFGRIGRASNDPPGPHALTSVSQLGTNNTQPRLYIYDANGAMTNLDGLVCAWDFKQRLVRAENSEMMADYTYDHANHRIIRKVCSAPSKSREPNFRTTIYAGKYFEVREHDAPTKFVWNGDVRVARVIGSLSDKPLIQRLRLFRGWNLVSLTVRSTLAAGDPGSPDDPLIEEIWSWASSSSRFEPTDLFQMLPGGAIVWLLTRDSGMITAHGAYTDSWTVALDEFGGFIASPGLRVWNLLDRLPADTQIWNFDALEKRWRSRTGPDLPSRHQAPQKLPPGQACYVVAARAEELAIARAALDFRYYHQDHLGSCSVMTDQDGIVFVETASYPFGFPRNEFQAAGAHEEYQFTQKEQDQESGLHYFEARYLSSLHGRFMSPDPLLDSTSRPNPQAWNCYAYTLQNPLKYVDPQGLFEYDASVTAGQRKAFESALDLARRTANTLSGSDRDMLTRALNAYGDPGVRNGVTVTFGRTTGHQGHTDFTYSRNSAGVVDRKSISADFMADLARPDRVKRLARTIVHEGTHVHDIAAVLNEASNPTIGYAKAKAGSLNLTFGQQDIRAYTAESILSQALGDRWLMKGSETLWHSSWSKLSAAEISQKRSAAIQTHVGKNPPDLNNRKILKL